MTLILCETKDATLVIGPQWNRTKHQKVSEDQAIYG